jgi:16S rRNA processing protein RimM
MDPKLYVALAEVGRPHGVGGELRLKVYNLDSQQLWSQRELRIVSAEGEARTMRVESLREVPNGALLRLAGVSSREAAEALRGARIEVPREVLEPPADGEYYIADLIGCEVELAGGRLGVVREVVSYPTCDALLIDRDGEGPLEVPLHADYVDSVNVTARKVALLRIDDLE